MRFFARKQNRTVPKRQKPTLYDNLIFEGYRYSLTKAIDITLAVQQTYSVRSVRIRSVLSFKSAYTEVYSVEGIKDGVAEITVNSNGFAGIEGTLPDPYVEDYVLYSRGTKQAVLDFFDIFNSTIVTAQYLFNKKQVVPYLSVKAENSLVGKIISSLSGFGFGDCNSLQLANLCLPKQFQISAQNLFWRHSRSADMLKALLTGFFDVEIEIEQFVGGLTFPVSSQELSRVGTQKGRYNSLGKNFILGSRTWDSALGIIIHVKNLDFEMYKSFLPKQSERDTKYSKLFKFKTMIKNYVPNDMKVKIIFHLRAGCVHGARLNDPSRLGADFFIGGRISKDSPVAFEEYVQ